jgi:hypothetical protein
MTGAIGSAQHSSKSRKLAKIAQIAQMPHNRKLG